MCGEGIVWEDNSFVASHYSPETSEKEFGAMGGGSAALNLHRAIYQEMNLRGEFQITESCQCVQWTAQVKLILKKHMPVG